MQATLSKTTLRIEPSDAALGADVLGIDMRGRLSAAEVRAIQEAWARHLVLRFRGQEGATVEDLARFSRNFGELDKRPKPKAGTSINDLPPEITVISNVEVNGEKIGGLGSDEAEWHTDMSYNANPPKGACLFSVEIPPAGGDTFFSNMYLAHDRLPQDLKERAASLKCVHDASRNSVGDLRVGFKEVTDPRETVGAVHPVVRTHPESGNKCLFLGRRRNAYLVGLPLEESERLLDLLWQHATAPGLSWKQVWKVGDAVLWDNRCTMHRRDGFDPKTRRMMFRTQIAGEAVFS